MAETIGRLILSAVTLSLIAAFGGGWATAILISLAVLVAVFVKPIRGLSGGARSRNQPCRPHGAEGS